MADAAVFDLSDRDTILAWLRGAVARLAFPGVGTEAAKRVAPAARVQDVADAIRDAYARRADAREAAAS